MSTFGGRMLEYKFASIDRFDGINLKSAVYFLSHNHSDHTVGLGSDAFAQRLESNPDIKLYCSIVTKDLLLADDRYSRLRNSIVALPMQEQTTIDCSQFTADDKTNEAQSFCVTLLPSGHCMGSVMFLFDGSEGCVLYTGDFRFAVGDAARMKPLHTEPSGHTKEIKSMYLDTTFLLPDIIHIPSREESRDHAIEITESWLAESKSNMIVLHTKAYIGYEYLMIELAKRFNTKIHVDEKKYEMYCKCSDEIAQHVTTEPSETQIHACTWGPHSVKQSPLPCGYSPIMLEGSSLQAHTIVPSTMFFARNHGYEKNVFRPPPKKGRYRVCYSFHSSYTEIRDFVTYLKPHRAYPNVIPPDQNFQETQNRLNRFLDMVHSAHTHGGAGDGHEPLTLKRRRQRSEGTPADDSQPDSLLGELSGLTPKKRQKTEVTSEDSAEKMDSETTGSQTSNTEQAGDSVGDNAGDNVIDNEADDSQGHELSVEESQELQSQLCIDSDELGQRSSKMKSIEVGEVKMLIDNSDDEDDDDINEDELLGLSDDEANKTDSQSIAKEDDRLKSIIEKLGDKVGDVNDLEDDEDSENKPKTDRQEDNTDCEVIELSDEEDGENSSSGKTALPPPPGGVQHGLVVSSLGPQAPHFTNLPEGVTMQGGTISVPKGFVPMRQGDQIVLVPQRRKPRIPKNMTKINGVETFDITESGDEEESTNEYSDEDSYLDESDYSSESDYSDEDDQSLAQVDLKRLNKKMAQKICTCGTDDDRHDDDCLAYNPADDDADDDEILFLESVDSPQRSPESEKRLEKEVQALKNKINQIEAERVEKESENSSENKDEAKKDDEPESKSESADKTKQTDDDNNEHKDENGINEDDLLKDDDMDNEDINDDILNEENENDLLGTDPLADTEIKEKGDKVKDIVEGTDISDVLEEIDAAV